jgi:hypothetical protein
VRWLRHALWIAAENLRIAMARCRNKHVDNFTLEFVERNKV